jgi:hypothetical protein
MTHVQASRQGYKLHPRQDAPVKTVTSLWYINFVHNLVLFNTETSRKQTFSILFFGTKLLSNTWTMNLVRILILLSVFVRESCAVPPPHPEASHDAYDIHRSLYKDTTPTKLLHPKVCHDLGEEECLAWDQTMQDNARKLQEIGNTTGFVRVLVLLVRFSDHVNKSLPPRSEIDTLFNGDGIDGRVTPTGSIKDWYRANSYGRMRMEAEVIDWITTNNTELHFSRNQSGITHDFRFSMYPILDELDKQGFVWNRFDQNKDDLIDSIVLLHSGYAAELGDIDCYTNRTTGQRIWSHAVGFQDNNWVSKRTGIRANSYAVG